MIPSIPSIFALTAGLSSLVHAQYPENLVGTWTTKSKAVITGPSFYNPVEDRIIEPKFAGISYSFTQDGYYEEAYYRAIPNPTTPKCPSTILQWQHGTYSLPGNGSLVLEPFSVDGRQLLSSPCSYDESIYTRYDQSELIKNYAIYTDPYHNVPRLDLYRFDGSPIQPMYLVLSPPQMLPTQTLNPTASSTPAPTKRSALIPEFVERLVKRTQPEDLEERDAQEVLMGHHPEAPLNRHALFPVRKGERWNPDQFWWIGVGMVAVGTVLYMWPEKVEQKK